MGRTQVMTSPGPLVKMRMSRSTALPKFITNLYKDPINNVTIGKLLHLVDPMAASLDAILLIDGYNIIGAWTALARKRDRHGLEAARDELVSELVNYSAFQGYQTRLIFDAHQRRDSYGSSECINPAFEVHYTEFGETADTYIELFCAQARCQLPPKQQRLIVATNDRAQQLTVVGYGAEWMSAQQLLSEVECSALNRQRHQRNARKLKTRIFSHGLDPAAKKKLEKWRHGLS
jgi:uncharacterized protein